ncbi:MAG: hypothetical protein OCC49_15260 [Fibrobacterales bacterium]
MKILLPLFTAVPFLILLGCNLTQTETEPAPQSASTTASIQQPELTKLAENLFDIPAAIGGTSSNKVLSQGALKNSNTSLENKTYKAYESIPQYIALTQKGKEVVQSYIKKINNYYIPDALTWVDGALTITITRQDETSNGNIHSLVTVKAINDGELVLHLNYWKNANREYQGTFYYYEREKVNELGNHVSVHFNGQDKEKLGSRMIITFYQTPENLAHSKDTNGPQIVRVNAVKYGVHVVTTGGSYHPTFRDAFWNQDTLGCDQENTCTPKAYMYAFQAAAHLTNEVGVFTASFAPADSLTQLNSSEYAIDQVTISLLHQAFIKELTAPENSQNNFLNLVLWSIETNQSVALNKLDEAFAYKPTMSATEMTRNEYLYFLSLNEEWLRSEGHGETLDFISATQPIFFNRTLDVIGDGDDEANGVQFGIESSVLSHELAIPFNPEDLTSFDPTTEQIINW